MVLCTTYLLNLVVFKLQVAFNIDFIVVERTNVCYLSSSTVLLLSYMYVWQVKAKRTKLYNHSVEYVTPDGVHMQAFQRFGFRVCHEIF